MKEVLCFLLFILECYHVIGHSVILFRIRLLPRKDLIRIRYYFLIDTLTVFSVYVYTRAYWWQDCLTILQILQHLYFFIYWDQTKMAREIVTWSSLDYQITDHRHKWAWLESLGTLFDTLVHLVNILLLASLMTPLQILLALVPLVSLTYIVLFNPKLAWSNPLTVPAWVQRRIKPIEADMWRKSY